MLTATAFRPTDPRRFVLLGLAASLGVFGVLRLSWIAAHVVLPITRIQGGIAQKLFGAPTLPIEVTLACSGADALALCLGAVLAYPVPWRRRMAGAAGGAALIVALNTLRIGTLGRAVASPTWFSALHIYIWPALLTLAIVGYVFAWMRLADRPSTSERADSTGERHLSRGLQPSRQFIVLTVVFLLLFVAASPLYLESAGVLALASVIARTAAAILNFAGITAHAAGNVLWTARGGVLVTQECISTPLIPVYLAAVCTYAITWRRIAVGLLATLPLFMALGAVRLLLVALPDLVTSPIFFVHAFYQLLLGAVVVVIAAHWSHGGRAAAGYALAGIFVGVLFVVLFGPFYTGPMISQSGAPLDDPQGAIALLPAFQVGLFLALWVAAFLTGSWKRFLSGLAAIGLTQVAGFLLLNALADQSTMSVHVRDVRAWAIAGPVLIFAAVVNFARPPR